MSDTDEVLLEFKRFPAEKQEQIRQLVSYCTLMGLNGKDLISIGGKLDRLQERHKFESSLAIGLSYKCVTVGKSAKEKERNQNRKWYYTDGNGVKWKFDRDCSYYNDSVVVTNCDSGKQKTFYHENFVKKPRTNARANIMANVHYGTITLNF